MPEPEPTSKPARQSIPVQRPYGWQWYTSKTGSWLRPKSTAYLTQTVANTLAPTGSGPGRITIVVDRDDSVEVADRLGRGCRRSGRFVVHTSPRLQAVARLQCELLRAVGKHWDRTAQGGDAPLGQLTRAWLRAERARDLIVLRAHQISGPALRWLLDLAATDGLRLWLITPRPLPDVTTQARGATIRGASPTDATTNLACDHDTGHHGCEDLNQLAPTARADTAATTRPAMRTARLLRRLYDLEAAALATGAVLMGCPSPDELATAGIRGGRGRGQRGHRPRQRAGRPGIRPSAATRLGRTAPAATGVGARRRHRLLDPATRTRPTPQRCSTA